MKNLIIAILLILLMLRAASGQSDANHLNSTSTDTGLKINGVQVVGPQQPAINNADGTLSSANATINAILDRMRKHGLIETPVAVPDVPDLLRLYEADALSLTNAASVASWTDASSNAANATQSNPDNRPIFLTNQVNGLPAVRFNGRDNWLNFAPVSNIRAVYIVVKHSLASPNFDTALPGLVIGHASSTDWAGDSGIQFTSFVTGKSVLEGRAFESGVEIPVASVTKSPFEYQLYTFFTTNDSPAQYIGLDRSQLFQGDVAAIALYSSVPSDQNHAKLVKYFRDKYKLSLPKAIIFDGNSLTTDKLYESQVLPSQVWTTQIRALLAASGYGVYDAFNFAHNGQNQDQMNTAAPTLIDPICAMGRAKCVVTGWEGTNDLSTGTTGHNAYLKVFSYGQARLAAGAQVIIATAIKRGDWAPVYETQRQAYNSELLANCSSFATACVNLDEADFYNNTTGALGADGVADFSDPNNTIFFRPDKLHITATGNGSVARAKLAAILSLP